MIMTNIKIVRRFARGPMTTDGQKCVLSFGGIDLINAVFQAISFLLVNGKI